MRKTRAKVAVGAGDAFNSGFIYASCVGKDIKESLDTGNQVAAFKLLGSGARHLPTKELLEEQGSRELSDRALEKLTTDYYDYGRKTRNGILIGLFCFLFGWYTTIPLFQDEIWAQSEEVMSCYKSSSENVQNSNISNPQT